jgi:uncharacterized damage-inducible protein DinB
MEAQMPHVTIRIRVQIAAIAAALAIIGMLIPGVARAQEMPAGKTFALAAELVRGYQNVQRNLTEAAEKMPADQYNFKPTPEIRPFGQLVAHAAIEQFGMCAVLKGEPNPKKSEKEDATRTKDEAIALLKASTTYCDPLVTALTDAAMPELTKMESNQVAKGLVPISVIAHGDEMYGTMAVYLRLKGIVPPTTERMKAKQQMSKSQ